MKPEPKKSGSKEEKSYSVNQIRVKYKDAYQPWTSELDKELTILFRNNVSRSKMAIHFGRTHGAISSRIKKLELENVVI